MLAIHCFYHQQFLAVTPPDDLCLRLRNPRWALQVAGSV